MIIAVVVWTFAWLFVSRWFWDSVWWYHYKFWMTKALSCEDDIKMLEDRLKEERQAHWMWKRKYEQEVRK